MYHNQRTRDTKNQTFLITNSFKLLETKIVVINMFKSSGCVKQSIRHS